MLSSNMLIFYVQHVKYVGKKFSNFSIIGDTHLKYVHKLLLSQIIKVGTIHNIR